MNDIKRYALVLKMKGIIPAKKKETLLTDKRNSKTVFAHTTQSEHSRETRRASINMTSSAKNKASALQTKPEHTHHSGSILTYLSAILSVLSLVVAISGYRASREEWTQSGAKLEYALTSPINHHGQAIVLDKDGKQIAGSDGWASQLHVLLTNTGRLTAVVISVQITSTDGREYSSSCSNQEVTIAPGESKLVAASFKAHTLPNVAELYATLASGQALQAKPVESDKTSLNDAFAYAMRHQEKETIPSCRIT